jgi:hypothetical protein
MWKRKEEGVERNAKTTEEAMERTGTGRAKHQVTS